MHKRRFYNFIIFLIWPFLSLIFNYFKLKLNDSGSQKTLAFSMFLFMLIFGLNYFVLESTNSDDKRFMEIFLNFKATIHSFNDLFEYVKNSKAPLEIIFPTITFLLAHYTGSLLLFFIVLSVFFGFFYSKNLLFFLKFSNQHNLSFLKYLMILFLFIFPFWDAINGFRFAAGSHMLFYFVTQNYDFEYSKMKKFNYKYLFMFTSVFMHSSLLLVVFLYLFSILFSYHRILFYLFFLVWFLNTFELVNQLNLEKYVSNFSLGPEEQKKSLDGYLSKSTIENERIFANSLNWNIKVQKKLFNSIILISVFLIYSRFKIDSLFFEKSLLNFSLILLIIGFFLEIEVSSFGRYIKTGSLFLFLLVSRLENFSVKSLNRFIVKTVVTVYLIFFFRLSFDLIPINSILPSYAILNPDKMKIVEWWEKYGGIND